MIMLKMIIIPYHVPALSVHSNQSCGMTSTEGATGSAARPLNECKSLAEIPGHVSPDY